MPGGVRVESRKSKVCDVIVVRTLAIPPGPEKRQGNKYGRESVVVEDFWEVGGENLVRMRNCEGAKGSVSSWCQPS